ncbi:MAG: TetR/AcrR family transcriptional regulator [Trebonia sp.]
MARRKNTKALLVAAAREAIVEVGWSGANSRWIATRAGLPLGTLNYHFRSKDDLLRLAAVTGIKEMFAAPRSTLTETRTAAELLEFTVSWSGSDALDRSGKILLLEATLASLRDPGLADEVDELIGQWRHLLADRLHALGVPGDDAHALAAALVAALDGLVLHRFIDRGYPSTGTAELGAALRERLDRLTGDTADSKDAVL